MAISTLDGLLAGMQHPVSILKVGTTMEAIGVLHSLAYATGNPGAMVAPSPGVNGAALTTYAGQILRSNPGTGNAYLARLEAAASVAGTLILADRLWHNSGLVVTTTTAQAITTPAWPARDRDGTANGSMVMVGIEVSTATTNAGAIANTTMSYTNQDGTAGRTATIASFPATAVAGTFVPFQLQAGDTGVRSIQSVTLGTSYAAGAIHIVAYRILARLGLPVANVAGSIDGITGGLPRIYNDTVPWLLWQPTATTAITLNATYAESHG